MSSVEMGNRKNILLSRKILATLRLLDISLKCYSNHTDATRRQWADFQFIDTTSIMERSRDLTLTSDNIRSSVQLEFVLWKTWNCRKNVLLNFYNAYIQDRKIFGFQRSDNTARRVAEENNTRTLKNEIASFKKMEKALTDTQIFMGWSEI